MGGKFDLPLWFFETFIMTKKVLKMLMILSHSQATVQWDLGLMVNFWLKIFTQKSLIAQRYPQLHVEL